MYQLGHSDPLGLGYVVWRIVMKCPKCGNMQTAVVDSRQRPDRIFRRRYCPKCKERFNTAEILEEDYDLMADLRNAWMRLVNPGQHPGQKKS
jgi:ribosomal protein L33